MNVEIKSIYNIEKIRNGIENSNPMWKIGDRIKVTSQINRIHEGKIYAITPTSIRIGDDIIYDVDFTDEISVHVNRNKWNTFITKLVAKKEQEFSPSIYKIEQSLYDQAGNKYKMTKFQGAWYTDDGIEKLANKKWASLIQERVIKLQRIEFSAIGFIWYANNWYPKDVAKQMYAEAQERSRCRECGGSGEVWETRIGSRWYQHSGPSNFNASDGGYRDRRAKCKECNGTGHVTFEYCPDCNGKKRIYKTVMYGNRLAQQIMPCPSCNGSGRK